MSAIWIDLPTAAQRSGRNVGHLRRRCKNAWLAKGLARKNKPPRGKALWLIREDADASFARVKFAEQIGTDLRHVTEVKRREAIRRRDLLARWEKSIKAAFELGFEKDAGTGRFLQQLYLDEGTELSRTTLYNWHQRWRAEGLIGLVDGRGAKRKSQIANFPDPFLDEVKRLYLNLRRRKLTVCHEIAADKAREQGWTIRSYKTCQRFLDTIPLAVKLKFRDGEEAYVNEAEPFIERDYSQIQSNQIWCGDHHQFDVIVRAGDKLIRPWLTAWQDLRSRKIVGWQIFAHDPNQDTILAAFRDAVLEHGVPETVLIDNGKDFDSRALNGRTKKDRWLKRKIKIQIDADHVGGIFGALGVAATHSQPYHGQSKPIERFFGTLCARFSNLFDTYCGNAPQNKPEDLQLQLERGKAPPLADFISAFGDWLANDYHARGHAGDSMEGKSPEVIFAEQLQTKRAAPVELLDVLLLKKSQPLRVTQNGVTWRGLRYGRHDPALIQMLGREVTLRIDDRQINQVSVWTMDDKFICVAQANARISPNADSQTVRLALSEKRQHRKLLKDYHSARPRLTEDLPDRMIRAAAARRQASGERPDPNLPPPSIRPVRSPIEDQLPALRSALEVRAGRIAVGAEMIDPKLLSRAVERREVSEPADDTFHVLSRAMKLSREKESP